MTLVYEDMIKRQDGNREMVYHSVNNNYGQRYMTVQ